ncbi:hypothetical protein [Frankia sp. Cr2]|nr:hypothetical protein [Frankia sp. Cr2]
MIFFDGERVLGVVKDSEDAVHAVHAEYSPLVEHVAGHNYRPKIF